MDTSDILRITLIQTSLSWENAESNRASMEQKISGIAQGTSDLILLPEMFSTGFTMNAASVAEEMNGPTMKWLALMAKKTNCVITGSIVIGDKGNYYNRLVWMRPNGTFSTYDKRHLFRMGEENNVYKPGTERLIVHIGKWRICPLVCYDLRFPVWSRNRGDYDLLLFVANWPERRSYAWKQLLIARAIENQCYVAGLNRIGEDGNKITHSGDSAVIDPKGEVMSTIKPHEETIQTISLSYADLEQYRKDFPVGLDADPFTIG